MGHQSPSFFSFPDLLSASPPGPEEESLLEHGVVHEVRAEVCDENPPARRKAHEMCEEERGEGQERWSSTAKTHQKKRGSACVINLVDDEKDYGSGLDRGGGEGGRGREEGRVEEKKIIKRGTKKRHRDKAAGHKDVAIHSKLPRTKNINNSFFFEDVPSSSSSSSSRFFGHTLVIDSPSILSEDEGSLLGDKILYDLIRRSSSDVVPIIRIDDSIGVQTYSQQPPKPGRASSATNRGASKDEAICLTESSSDSPPNEDEKGVTTTCNLNSEEVFYNNDNECDGITEVFNNLSGRRSKSSRDSGKDDRSNCSTNGDQNNFRGSSNGESRRITCGRDTTNNNNNDNNNSRSSSIINRTCSTENASKTVAPSPTTTPANYFLKKMAMLREQRAAQRKAKTTFPRDHERENKLSSRTNSKKGQDDVHENHLDIQTSSSSSIRLKRRTSSSRGEDPFPKVQQQQQQQQADIVVRIFKISDENLELQGNASIAMDTSWLKTDQVTCASILLTSQALRLEGTKRDDSKHKSPGKEESSIVVSHYFKMMYGRSLKSLCDLFRRKSWRRKFCEIKEHTLFFHLWHDDHFVLFVLHIQNNSKGALGRRCSAFLIDSFGTNYIPRDDLVPLQESLRGLDPSLILTRTHDTVQADDYNCGVYVVLFTAAVAMWLAKGGQMSDFSLDSALRQLEISANMILNPQTEWQKEVNNRIIQDVRSSLWCAQSTEASAVEGGFQTCSNTAIEGLEKFESETLLTGCNVNRESRRRESIVLD
mmetsp:Transcript_25721/g.41578  ORF Transcript_25721/g.41578 Transcript_25721/m.41578 type:complete len:764 (+) Transcript_25721:124-2415(+)